MRAAGRQVPAMKIKSLRTQQSPTSKSRPARKAAARRACPEAQAWKSHPANRAIPRAAAKARKPSSKRSRKAAGNPQAVTSPPGQGEEPGSTPGGNKPNGKPGDNKGGTADGDQPGQKDPGKTGEPTQQDSSGAPDPQMDRENGEKKTGDAQEGLNQSSDKSQSPGNSPHESESKSDTKGDRKGGGGGGGGEGDKKTGKGKAGSHSAADEGGSVSNEKGQVPMERKPAKRLAPPIAPIQPARSLAMETASSPSRTMTKRPRTSHKNQKAIQSKIRPKIRATPAATNRGLNRDRSRPRSLGPAAKAPDFLAAEVPSQPAPEVRPSKPRRRHRPNRLLTRQISSSPTNRSIWPWSTSRIR